MATLTGRPPRDKLRRIAPHRDVSSRPSRTVVTCYDMLDLVNETAGGGIEDFTDGIYGGDPTTRYVEAQRKQSDWLLDQVGCGADSRLLDIGCGNGTLLERARIRGARATGITISPQQVARCRRKGLDVRLCDYRSMDAKYENRFDCVIANGSIEHFVQAKDAAAGRADEIYRRMFAVCRRVLDPATHAGRFATTVIHFGRVRIDPREMAHRPRHVRWGSDAFHYAMLVHSFGGFYPVPGQLERAAAPSFWLVDEHDGTEDYRLTSEHWLRVLKASAKWRPRF